MIFSFKHTDKVKALLKVSDWLGDKDGKFTIEVRKSAEIRSLNQNRYYRGVVIPYLIETFGYEPEEMHQIMAAMFLMYLKEGTIQEFVRSTTTLSKAEFEDYLEKIRRWAFSEQGIKIPLPNEVTEEIYMQLQNKYGL